MTPQPCSTDTEIDRTDAATDNDRVDDIVLRMSPVGKRALLHIAQEGPQPAGTLQASMRNGLLTRQLIRPEVALPDNGVDATVAYGLTDLGEQVAATLAGPR